MAGDSIATTQAAPQTRAGILAALERALAALVGAMSARGREGFDSLALILSLVFLGVVFGPALEFVHEEAIITPALEVSNMLRAAALPVGIGLMVLFGLFQLARFHNRRMVVGVALGVVAAAAILHGISPLLRPLGNYNLLIFFVGLVAAMVLAGVPIAFTFGLATFCYLAVATRLPVIVVVGRMDEGMSHIILLAVPLFVFLGLLIEMTGMAWSLTQSGFSATLAEAMKGLPGGASMFLLVSALAFIILGSVLEGIPAIVQFGPLMFPIARQVGVHEVHYAMVVILAMGIGLFAPPFGVGYYAACAISRVHPDAGMKPIIGYMLALIIGLLIVVAFPWISIGFL